ncbi:relaxase/mobilization nuclease domain-containing protein [Flavobacterium endoglycinae]|uniref:Relaxase/mobilization nuclease domain-containing protein n=1 Tax=Flavobacterium endoglycinae TaxID=2816357 RepID=A0ABX7QFX3_9FLAO|nr:relaxase/mobilization nuclease domain-containing protein [Flavobacterium endoglycinae]QSW89590.1 relaxase/mobilization nuclease domain-containing protein [Flavobacterium endoglycinae]
MVAVIKTGSSVHNIFNYNENKVKEGIAEFIGEGNYPLEAAKLTGAMKLNRLLKQNSLNENVKRNSVHISLNFDPSESALSNDKMLEIAEQYMQKIGFGNQPYLIYRHYDAGHPHMHLVSIKIREDGSRIDMQNIGRNQSEDARREIEKTFGLVQAQLKKRGTDQFIRPLVLSKIKYGKTESKRAVQSVLDHVLSAYKYKSLSELNAVLGLYNVRADRGEENSRIFKTNGLLYRTLDENGKPIGVPLKASEFYNKPTLKFLHDKFQENNKTVYQKKRIANAVDLILLGRSISLSDLAMQLGKEGIDMVFRKSELGQLYGITYVDHLSKCVLNGSDLGKQYSAKQIEERCGLSFEKGVGNRIPVIYEAFKSSGVFYTETDKQSFFDDLRLEMNTLDFKSAVQKIIEVLTRIENDTFYVPNQLKKASKKKRVRRRSNNL